MPSKNHFQHQKYTATEPISKWRLLTADFPAQPNTKEFTVCCERFSESLSSQVDAIYLVHGTFAGNDALGWFAQMERIVPSAGPVLKKYGKKLTDVLAGDDGNFTPQFQSLFPQSLAIRRFVWSGENTHSGRCKAAIELLDELLSRIDSQSRVLLWAHSHAANVVALITNLIAADSWVRDQFFELVEPLVSAGNSESNVLSRVRSAIESQQLKELKLDVVSFGSPITYGWDSEGYRRLIHVVNHAPVSGHPDWLCPLATSSLRSSERPRGDIVQILGITGSDFLPWLLNGTTRSVEKSLHQFLAGDFSRRDWWSRASIGMRVADEGETILIAYDNTDGHATQTLGHSVYTKPQWLSFHMNLVSELYCCEP